MQAATVSLLTCTEKERLSERYRAAVTAYKQALDSLDALSGDNFAEGYERAEGIRLLYVQARRESQRHIAEHRC